MDRKHMVAQRARDYFGERFDDVIPMIRQDRQEMRGWQEPAHVRAVARRMVREAGTGQESETTEVLLADLEFGRTAGEPDRGQQREALGLLLEAAVQGLEKVGGNRAQEMSCEEMLGVECTLLLYGRPAVQINQGRLASPPPLWNLLEDQREDIEMAQRGVGRIELLGHPEYAWAGTGFLVSENCLLTTRRTADLFAEQQNNAWQFRPAMSAWMNYRASYQRVASAGYRVRSVLGMHDRYDVALLEVEPPQLAADAPTPLAIAARPPERLEGRPVYLIGYPVRDDRRNEPECVTRIFRDVYNVKRVQPGMLRGALSFRDVELLRHDCGPLGQNAGGCLVDLKTHQVLGIHLAGRYLEPGTAVPLWTLREDPLLRRAGVTFAEITAEDMETITNQLERLARSRYWGEVQQTIGVLYQRAFGKPDGR